MKVAALVPGLTDGVALLAAWQKTVAGFLNDAAAFIVVLVVWNLAPLAFGTGPTMGFKAEL
jgi:hypothetical protein